MSWYTWLYLEVPSDVPPSTWREGGGTKSAIKAPFWGVGEGDMHFTMKNSSGWEEAPLNDTSTVEETQHQAQTNSWMVETSPGL